MTVRERPQLKHGLSYTPEYRAWQLMRLRCIDPKHRAYPRYGGRGIKIYSEWLNDPAAFVAYIGPKPSPKHEIDRFPDNNGNYEPGNVRWATRSENDRNRRNNRIIEFRGESLPLVAWAERIGLSTSAVWKRLAAGWSIERTLTEPRGPTGPKVAA